MDVLNLVYDLTVSSLYSVLWTSHFSLWKFYSWNYFLTVQQKSSVCKILNNIKFDSCSRMFNFCWSTHTADENNYNRTFKLCNIKCKHISLLRSTILWQSNIGQAISYDVCFLIYVAIGIFCGWLCKSFVSCIALHIMNTIISLLIVFSTASSLFKFILYNICKLFFSPIYHLQFKNQNENNYTCIFFIRIFFM